MVYLTKEHALHAFWSSFGWKAWDEGTTPDDAMARSDGHYITYSVSTAALDEPIPISGNLWVKDNLWGTINDKAESIAKAIGIGGILLQYTGGYLWICRGIPFSQRMTDPDDTIRRIYINLMAEYLSAD